MTGNNHAAAKEPDLDRDRAGSRTSKVRTALHTLACVIILGIWPSTLLEGFWLRGEVPYPRGVLESAHLPWACMSRTGPVRAANPLLSDPAYQFVPWDVAARKAWVSPGEPPLWNPAGGIGAPLVANPQAAVLDPVRLVATAVGFRHASIVRVWLRLFLAGLFFFGLLRHLGAGRSGALFGATAFELGGFMIPWLSHPHAGAALFLPAVLWAGDRLLQGGGFRPFLGLSLAFALQFLAGHPATSLHLATLAGVFWGVRAGWGSLRRWSMVAAALGVGILLASPMLIPFVEYMLRCATFHERAGGAVEATLPLRAASTFFVARIFGWPLDGNWSGPLNANEAVAYVGILPWLLAPWAWYPAARRRIATAALAVVLVSAAISYGMPGLREILERVPGFAWAANRRFLLGIAAGGALLGGLGLHGLFQWVGSRTSWPVRTALAVVLFAGIGAVAVAELDRGTWASFRQTPAAWIAFVAQAAAALAIVFGIRRRALSARWAFLFLPILVLDLTLTWRGYQPTASPSSVLATTPAIEAMRRRAAPGDRVLALAVPGRESVLTPNILQVHGLHDVRNFDTLGDAGYQDYLIAAMFHPTPTRLAAPELNVLGPRFIVAPVPLERLASSARLMPDHRHVVVFDEPFPTERLVLFSYLVEGERYEQDQVVGSVVVRARLADGQLRDHRFPLRAGRETAEGALCQLGEQAAHRSVDRARVFLQRAGDGRPYARHVYRATFPWPGDRGEPLGAEIHFTGPHGFLELEGLVRANESGREDETRAGRWSLIFRGELLVYENPRAWPRAFLVQDDQVVDDASGIESRLPPRHRVRPVEIRRPAPGCIRVAGESGPQDVLVVTEASFPGWTAVARNGDAIRPLEVKTAWSRFQAVPVGPGPFEVELRYRPWSFRWGLVAAGVGLCILAALLALRRKVWSR